MAGVPNDVNRGMWGAARVAVVFALMLTTTAPIASAAVGVSGPDVPDSGPDAPASGQGPADALDDAARFAQADAPTGNNSTVAHRNPREVSGASELSPAERWLASDFGDSLPENANVSEADRERARRLIDDNPAYARLAEQYAETAENSEGGERSAERIRAVGAAQQSFFAAVQQYREAHRTYERARRANRTLDARRLAHLLERHTAAVNQSARWLNQSYADLSANQRAELGNVTRTVGSIRSNVTATQQAVRDRTLVRTRLSVSANRSTASFTDPVELAGQLRTANGTPVADETVALAVGNRTLNVTTDARGRFETAYRPVLAAVGTRQRTVTLLPANASVYRRANATVRFAVEQVEPTVTITNHSDAVGYDETLGIGGRVEAGGVGVPNVPLVVTVGGVPVERVRTGPNGSFAASARLPANVSTGRQQVRVRLPVRTRATAGDRGWTVLSDRGLAPASAAARVTVRPTATNVSITDVRPIDRTAFVAGRLRTADGEPIPNQTVRVRAGGETVELATTNATGAFAATIQLPPNSRDADSVRVVAALPKSANLESSRASATAPLSSGGSPFGDDRVRLATAGLLGLAVLGVVVWRFRSDASGGFGRGSEESSAGVGDRGARTRSPEALLDSATEALDDGEYDAAAVAAYASVRERLRRAELAELDTRADGHRTHWEFYADCRDSGLSEGRLARLERLTATYERAAFAADPVSPGDAATAVEVARSYAPDREEGGGLGRGREESSGRGLGEGSAA